MTTIPARDVTPRIPRLPKCEIYVVAEYCNRTWEVTYSWPTLALAEDYVLSHETPERCRIFECRERRAK